MSSLALHGGEPVRKEPYLAWPVHDERDIDPETYWTLPSGIT